MDYRRSSAPDPVLVVPSPSEGRPGHHPELAHRRPYRAATTPNVPVSSHIHHYGGQPACSPQIYPAQGQRPPPTIHRPDIHFSPSMDRTYSDNYYQPHAGNGYFSTNAAQLYPPHQQRYTLHQPRSPSPVPPPKPPGLQQEVRRDSQGEPLHPAFYRSFVSSPPLPPKPDLLFETPAIPTSAYLGNASSASLASTPTPHVWSSVKSGPPPRIHTAEAPPYPHADTREESDDEGDELAVALALSKDESMREAERFQNLARQEDEELERALAASMQISIEYDQYWSQSEAGPSNYVSSSSSSGPSASDFPSASVQKNTHEESSSVPLFQIGSSDPEITPKEEPLSQIEDAEVPVENPTTILATQCLSIDVSERTEPLQSDDSFPKYSPNRTPTASAFPPEKTHAEPTVSSSNEEKSGDDENDDLPYLRRPGRDIPTNAASSGVPSLSSKLNGAGRIHPISKSFIDLSYDDYDDPYTDEDAALARRLAEEERRGAANGAALQGNESGHAIIPPNTSMETTSATSVGGLPSYDAVASTSSTGKPYQAAIPELRIDASPSVSVNSDLSRNSSLTSGASDTLSNVLETSASIRFPPAGSQTTTLQVDKPHKVIGRTSSMSALPIVTHPHEASSHSPSRTDDDISSHSASFNPQAVINTASATVINENSPPDIPATLGMLNANHFVDAELLHGVSINFTPPIISDRLSPMQGQMPTLISLPYGRCPPLHFQATSWRHLLKLMARLSGTKMEPTVEALAVNKNELLKLRTVVQFIKPHHMSREWRTVLWFTIDQPIPLNASNAQRYQIANVNTLPWSYTLSSVPTMLKDASDTLLSKTYTIPATPSVPFPSLPITFSNLALYLQAALDDSRRQSESNPHHKLAKMVEICYANDNVTNGIDDPDKPTGVSGLFKKVIGKGSKKGKRNGGGNEETFDRVTPFIPGEWG